MYDIVYTIKFGNHNPELRYSLRSLVNLREHGQVVIAGFVPEWVQNVVGIEVEQAINQPYVNTTNILRAVCHDPRVSDDFILMNDDFYFNKPISTIPTYHRGELFTYLENIGDPSANAYHQGMFEAWEYLKGHGIDKPLNYDLHTPMLINKQKMASILKELTAGFSHKRSLYGNLHCNDTEFLEDVKVYGKGENWSEDQLFLSTDDDAFAFGSIGKYIQLKFRARSQYERSKV